MAEPAAAYGGSQDGVKLEIQLSASATATAQPDLSHVCILRYFQPSLADIAEKVLPVSCLENKGLVASILRVQQGQRIGEGHIHSH